MTAGRAGRRPGEGRERTHERARASRSSIDDLAQAALARFGLPPEATAALCNVSENHTYRVDDPATGRAYALRVHRPGYRTAPQIESELQWLDALRRDGAVDTCVPVPAPGGERVVQVTADGLGSRNVVLFEWLPGTEPDPEGEEAIAGFRTLGAVSARMHAHARAWPRPTASTGRSGTTRTRSAPHGYWGRWQDGLGIGAGGARAAGAARRDGRRPARGATAGRATASGSSTPTSASRTSSSTTATCA